MKLARDIVANLAGYGGPLVLAIIAIPALLHALGTARFGLLSLIWTLVTYFGFIELGLGRALTIKLAGAFERGDEAAVGRLCGTALPSLALLGSLGALSLTLATPWLIGHMKGLPDIDEAVRCVRWMSLATPLVVVSVGLMGVMEARKAFGALNVVRLLQGMWTFAGPWAVVHWHGPDLVAMAIVLVSGRAIGTMAYGLAATRFVRASQWRWQKQELVDLARTGGWVSVTNVVSPLMGSADRLCLGPFVSASAISFYATAQEMALRLGVLTGAWSSALFPRFAGLAAVRDPGFESLMRSSLRWMARTQLILTLGVASSANWLLTLWLGAPFAQGAAASLQIFALAMFASALAQLPYLALQGAGHARSVALLHCVELPLYWIALVLTASSFGIEGVAVAWLARVTLDAIILFRMTKALPFKDGGEELFRAAMREMALGFLAFAGLWLPTFEWRLASWAGVSVLCLIACWRTWSRRHAS